MARLWLFGRNRDNTIQENSSKEDLTIQDLIQGNTQGWSSKFISDIYGETTLYPHEEMLRAYKSYRTNSYIYAAVNTLRDFIIGGEIRVEAEDEETEGFLNEFLDSSGLRRALSNAILDLIIVGNAYLERIYMLGRITSYKYNNNPQRIFIDYNYEKNTVKRYIQEIPNGISLKNIKNFSINYYDGRVRSVRGIELPRDKILHLKLGKNTIPFYGRGAVAVVVNDILINKELERSMAVISRYKAIPKKLITLKDATPVEVDNFKESLNNLRDFENPITNREVDIKDLTSPGNSTGFDNIIDYVKRKLTVALAPEYIIHGEETNRATAKEQRIGFLLRIKAIREDIAYYINKELRLIASQYKLDTNNIRIVFGSFDIGERQEKIDEVVSLWNNGLIRLNEAREMLGYEEDPDYGEFYKFELSNTPNESPENPEVNENEGAEKEKGINK